MKEDQSVARLRKTALEELCVSVGSWAGSRRLDIRIYVRGPDGMQPTRKGIAISESLYPDFKTAVIQFGKNLDAGGDKIAVRKKNGEEIRLSRSEFQGHQLVNIRVYYLDETTGDMKPTKRGITFSPNLFSEFQRAVLTAECLL